MRRLVALAALCCACVLLVAGFGGRAEASRPLVTPAELPGILARYWPENNRANRTQSVALQDQDEQGSAAAIDDEGFVLQRLYRASTHAGPPTPEPFSLPFAGGAVARQFRYPLVALEFSRVDCGIPTLNADAFIRDSPSASWREALEPSVNKALMPRLLDDSGGFAVPAFSDGRFVVGLNSLAAYVAGAMTRYASAGGTGTGLPDTMAPATKCWTLPDFFDERATAKAEGFVTTVQVRPAFGEPLAWSTQGGGAFVLLSLDASITFRAQSGRSLTPQAVPWIISGQDAAFSVRPGSYPTITIDSGVELAVLDPPAGHGAGVRVIGADSGLLPGSATH